MKADKERQGITASTLANYDLAERRLDELMDMPIGDVKLIHLQRIVDDNKESSRSTINKNVWPCQLRSLQPLNTI